MISILQYTIVFLLGLSLGSFINAWVWRTYNKKSICAGRSECTSCNVILRWYHNVPVLSFICLKGKCSSCKKPISFQYPIVELFLGVAFVGVFYFHGATFSGYESLFVLRDFYIVTILLMIFLYDLRYQLILDRLTLPAIAGLLSFTAVFDLANFLGVLLATVVGALFFGLQFVLSNGKWVGGGDIRLGALMGAILGWPVLLVALFFAYIGGALVESLFLLKKTKTMKSKTPFGTYLTAATLFAMWFGVDVLNWYLSLIK